MKLKKYELEQLLNHIIDICDCRNDPYAEDGDRLLQIRDLAAQAVGQKPLIDGRYNLPMFKKIKKK